MDVLENLKAIIRETGVKQRTIADALGVDESIVSNILAGRREIKANELFKISNALGVNVTYLLTYPKKYVDADTSVQLSERVSITFEVSPDKREHLIKLVTGNK